jgi:hypothetical protein
MTTTEATNTTEEVNQLIVGFLDGDGCITQSSSKNASPILVATQSYDDGVPPELLWLQEHLGGTARVARKKAGEVRTQWHLSISSRAEMEPALNLIVQHGILKREQATCALDYFQDREEARTTATKLRELKSEYASSVVYQERITDAYIAGLFMAEGNVGMYRNKHGGLDLSSKITKNGCVPLLHGIRSKLGFGSVCSGAIHFSSRQTIQFLDRVSKFITKKRSQKFQQLELVSNWYKTKTAGSGYDLTEQDKATMERIATKLKTLKRK